MNSNLYPVLLAGGSGTRLWPQSRKSYPKQFSKLLGELTLFQQAATRLKSTAVVGFNEHIMLTNSDFRFIVAEQCVEVSINPGHIIIEPEAKNTGAPILAACLVAFAKNEDAVLLIAPSDHVIPDTEGFLSSVAVGLEEAKKGKIVTFGVNPTHAATGYGYLELAERNLHKNDVIPVSQFIEKPDQDTAGQMLKEGNYLWNSGIFLFRARDMIEAYQKFDPQNAQLVKNAVENASEDFGFLRLCGEAWKDLSDISIDYVVMERASNIVAVKFDAKWSDLGDWNAIWSESTKDIHGNALSPTAHAINCTNSILRSDNSEQQLVGCGLNDIIAIAMKDAVLVADRNNAQSVKDAVTMLREKNIRQSDEFPKDHRPWGWFESLSLGDKFQVKILCVKPGAALSLQSHQFRSEHWVVVEGVVKVTVDTEVKTLEEGQSTYIPQGSLHRLENPYESPALLIEVQVGTYFGEDDIVRYDDVYNRDPLE